MRIASDLADAVGKTPLIKLKQASEETGCTILGKAEFMNPGGSIKDRIALSMIEGAEAEGRIGPGGTLVEATSGTWKAGLSLSTGFFERSGSSRSSFVDVSGR